MPKKSSLNTALKKVKDSGRYMVAVWHVEDGKLHCNRFTERFLIADVPIALELLQKDLATITVQNDTSPPV